MRSTVFFGPFVALILIACGDSAGPRATTSSNLPTTPTSTNDADNAVDAYAGSTELDVAVPASGRAYVRLREAPSVVTPAGDAASSSDWDIAFDGYDIFTNGGASGEGQGAAFGPFDPTAFASAAAPAVPFVSRDEAGGAFLDWYAYDSTTHVLFIRFHVYGVKSGGRLWKVQVLTYYGVLDNAPTSAMYQLRYAEVGGSDAATKTLAIDGTAGGLSAPASAPSACLDLASGNVTMLAPDAAKTASTWDLCFRRDVITVNGEAGGPRGVTAADLEASETAGEALTAVEAETEDGEAARFDGVTSSSFASATFRGDHIVSAFEAGGWVTSAAPPAPSPNQAWLVVDASGAHRFLVAFSAFLGATTASPGTVVMHIEPVRE